MHNDSILLESAEADLTAAARWYGDRRSVLEAEFLLCVEEALDRIAGHPRSFPTISGEYRKAWVHRFPFGVIYRLHAADALVVAVQHASRRPDLWQDRAWGGSEM
ncbi:MAG TPA: type II toxin-antitoxin system RelE/ParE family toxin [Urbifossiella sp.]|nr:type II toxin-antitoxin system RelE/ParE family toxin [Urbifossiella sp.]